jgi:hypothetical protein
MSQTRNNHYVPQWHQNGFVDERDNQLCHLKRRVIPRKDGSIEIIYGKKWFTSAQCTIITTAATQLMQPIHERMPVIMPVQHYRDWLDKSAVEDEAFQLLDNRAYTDMATTPISDYVNNPRHNDEQCWQ